MARSSLFTQLKSECGLRPLAEVLHPVDSSTMNLLPGKEYPVCETGVEGLQTKLWEGTRLRRKYFPLRSGQIVLNRYEPQLGFLQVPPQFDLALCDNAFNRLEIRAFAGRTDFLLRLINLDEVLEGLQKLMRPVKRPYLKLSDLLTFELPLPPSDRQFFWMQRMDARITP